MSPSCLWPRCAPLTFGRGFYRPSEGQEGVKATSGAARGFSSVVKGVQIPIHGTRSEVKRASERRLTGLRGWGSAGRGCARR